MVDSAAQPPAPASPRVRAFEQILGTLFALILCLSIVATLGVLLSGMPPLFNQRASVYRLGNIVCLVALVAVLAALLATLLLPRLRPYLRVLLLTMVAVGTLEGLLCVFDIHVISATGSPRRSAFRNVWVHGDPLWLGQPNAVSPYGFRNLPPAPAHQDDYRVLFLGSSFVSGSGSTLATNYPQVAAAALQSAMPDRHITVMSAGVDGYGMKEERLIYEYLTEQGQHFDLIVANFHMGSDFTDDIPGTFRKSVAGEAQRFPDNWFLRTFYPIDSYIFRYAYYFQVAFNPRFGAPDPNAPRDATCRASPSFIDYANLRTWLYYGPGARERLYLRNNIDELFKLDAVIKSNHARMVVVLLPDRFSVLAHSQPGLNVGDVDLKWTQRYMEQNVGTKLPMLDLTPRFENRPDLFLCNDLHWDDPGNVEGGQRVAAYLSQFIGTP